MIRELCFAGGIAASLSMMATMGHSATIQTAITVCSTPTTFDTFSEAGDWSRNVSGTGTVNGNSTCKSGSGVVSGSTSGIGSESESTVVASERSKSFQTILGARNIADYQFIVKADPSYTGGRARVTVNARVQGAYDIFATSAGTSASSGAAAILGGSVAVANVLSGNGAELRNTVRATIFPRVLEASDSGIIDEIVSDTALVLPDSIFDIRLSTNAFTSVGARYNIGGISAEATSTASAFINFDSITVGEGFCIQSVDAGVDTCADDDTTMAPVPLPASSFLLIAGIFGLFGARRFAKP